MCVCARECVSERETVFACVSSAQARVRMSVGESLSNISLSSLFSISPAVIGSTDQSDSQQQKQQQLKEKSNFLQQRGVRDQQTYFVHLFLNKNNRV